MDPTTSGRGNGCVPTSRAGPSDAACHLESPIPSPPREESVDEGACSPAHPAPAGEAASGVGAEARAARSRTGASGASGAPERRDTPERWTFRSI